MTWHQAQVKHQFWDPVKWVVLIDPPNECAATMKFDTKPLAEVYLRSLKENNPKYGQYASILPPGNSTRRTEARQHHGR
jgi:hypothetical protein